MMSFDYHDYLLSIYSEMRNLKLIKFSCLLGKYNKLQQKLEEYSSSKKIIKHPKNIFVENKDKK